MLKTSRRETAAILAVVVVFGLALTGLLVKNMRAATEPGVTLREAFAQPPGGSPPGRLGGVPVPPLPATPASPANPASGASSPPSGSAPPAPSEPASSAAAGSSPVGSSSANSSPAAESGTAASPSVPANTVSEIVVHVAGAVKKPGVYHLPAGSRNDDAIQKAGGPTAAANTDGINLASRIEDGSQLYLPTRKQHPEGGADAPTTTAEAALISPVTLPSTKAAGKPNAKAAGHAAAKSTAGAKGGKGGKFTDPAQGTVNINTASAEELQRIPGIGPAMAERILDFRKTSGKFTAPEDMLQISGIGEKKFAKMQPYIRVR